MITSQSGALVVIGNAVTGLVFHFLNGSWGRDIGGRMWTRGTAIPANVNHVIYYSEYPEARTLDRFAQQDRHKVLFLSSWTEIILALQEWHGGRLRWPSFPVLR